MMIKIILYLTLILIEVKFSYNYIVLPFNNIKLNNNNKEESIQESINNFLSNEQLYTLISLSDSLTTELYLNTRFYHFFLGKGLCGKDTLSQYTLQNSNYFKNISYCTNNIEDISEVCYCKEKFSVFSNIKLDENITLYNLDFLFGTNRYSKDIHDINKICGYIGLQLEYNNLDYKEYNFIKILKKERIIPTYTWSILYFNNKLNYFLTDTIRNKNQGLFIFGLEEKDYKEIFLTEDIRTTKAKPRFGILDWGLFFNDVYFLNKTNSEKSSYQNNIKISFDLESEFIIGTKYFFDSIEKTLFKSYIEKKICFINENAEEDGKYLIICNKEFSKYIETFPDIYFYNKEFNYTFILTNKELFNFYGNYIYFLIIHKVYYVNYWSLGTIFLKKYPFLFDCDKKTISYINIYNSTNIAKLKESNIENNIENNKKWFETLLSIFKYISIFVGIIIGILIGKKIWDKNRKKRANELNDDYQYESSENDNKNNKLIQLQEK